MSLFNLKNPAQGLANVVEQLCSTAEAAKNVANTERIRNAAEQLGISVKYVDLVIQVSKKPRLVNFSDLTLLVYWRLGYPEDGCCWIGRSILCGQVR